MLKVFIILFLIISSLHSDVKKTTLLLPWKHQFQFAGYYVAKEMGYYKQAGFEVEIKEYNLKRDNTKAVALHEYEFGVGHSSLMLDRLNKHTNIVLLYALYQSTPSRLLALKSSDIEKISDIAGKTVMMSRDQAHTASINAMLYSQGVPQNSFKVIDTSFTPLDLIKGESDLMFSYASNEPYILKQKGIEFTMFNPKDYGYNFYSDILFTSQELINRDKDAVDAFREASLRGWEYAFEHIDEAVAIILQNYNTQNKSEDALRFEAEVLKKLAFADNTDLGDINPIRVNEIMTTYRLLGLVKNTEMYDLNSLIYRAKNSRTILPEKQNNDYSITHELINAKYLKIFAIVFTALLFLLIYIKLRTDMLLKEKTQELNLKNKIFTQNVCSSRTNIRGEINFISEAYSTLCGYSLDELKGKTHNILKDSQTPVEVYKDLWMTISSGHTWRGELKNIKKDGTSFWANVVVSPVIDKNNTIIAYDSIIQDVSLKKVLQEFNQKLEEEVDKQTKKLKKLSMTDKLTGAYNRVKLDEVIESSYNYYQEFNENFSLIILDIDNFKLVNDEHGHLIGDEILKGVVKCIKESIRSTDILGRWGGEEFMVICPNADENTAYGVAQTIRKKIQSCKFPRVQNITISGGVADIYRNTNTDSLINSADNALYSAKESGRNMIKGAYID